MKPLRQKLIDVLTLKGYSERTHESYIGAVAGLAKHYHCSPELITDEQMLSYLLVMHHAGKAASTLNVAVSGLRFFYRHVLGRGIAQVEAMLPRTKRPKLRPRVYSVGELGLLFAKGCHQERDRAFLMTTYSAGLRLNEACHLTISDILSNRMALRIRGKGKKERYTILCPWTLEELRNYYRQYQPKRWLFPGVRDPRKAFNDMAAQRIFYRALERAGLPNRGGIHCLRHSFATHQLEAGCNLETLRRLLGHSSFTTTAGYLHVDIHDAPPLGNPLEASFDATGADH